jgi:hypothetical protein
MIEIAYPHYTVYITGNIETVKSINLSLTYNLN